MQCEQAVNKSNYRNPVIKAAFLLIVLQTLASCASSGGTDMFSQSVPKDYSNMYLRGVFNWWEANEDFKLLAQNEETYQVTIELIADGQPYDFKVADNAWTMSLNCGNEFGASPMRLGKSLDLVCASDSVNLQFTPSETGMYTFTLDVSNNDEPELSITLTP